ncbi:MAG: hypothetical protein ABJA84_09255, partial [Polaromonas sp.]
MSGANKKTRASKESLKPVGLSGADGDGSAPATWTRDGIMDLGKKKKLARAYAKKSDQVLLSDELICANCGSKRIESTTR